MGACHAQFTPKGPHLAMLSLLKVTKASSTCKRFAVSHNSKKTIFLVKTTLSWCHTSHSWIFTSWAEGSELRQGREGKNYWECCNENMFLSRASLQGAMRGCGEMPSHDMLQWIPAPGNSQVTPESTDLIPTTANLSQSQHFLPPLLPFAVIRRAKKKKKKKLFFYRLVKYNLLNVLCQCIKLPTMLIEYLIDIYLLTSYLC